MYVQIFDRLNVKHYPILGPHSQIVTRLSSEGERTVAAGSILARFANKIAAATIAHRVGARAAVARINGTGDAVMTIRIHSTTDSWNDSVGIRVRTCPSGNILPHALTEMPLGERLGHELIFGGVS